MTLPTSPKLEAMWMRYIEKAKQPGWGRVPLRGNLVREPSLVELAERYPPKGLPEKKEDKP